MIRSKDVVTNGLIEPGLLDINRYLSNIGRIIGRRIGGKLIQHL